MLFYFFVGIAGKFKDHVKSVLCIFSAHNKHNCRDPTVGILIKLEQSLVLFVSVNLIKIPTVGSDSFCYEQKICAERTLHGL